MSSTMWAWRVILPGLGLMACSLILRESSRPEVPNSTAGPTSNRTVSSPVRVIAEGRIVARPGAEVTVGSELGGSVLAVHAREKAKVRKGDVLVEFRPDDLKFSIAEAEARLTEADSDLAFHREEYRRKVRASTGPGLFEAELHGSRHDLEVAEARRKGAEIAVGRQRLALSRANVTSPIDGVVLASHVSPGQVTTPGFGLATICDLSRLRIEAEVDEFDVARIGEGNEVVIKAEGYGETFWRGKVEEIPDRVAGRTLRPDDPGRPTDTRVLLVKIGMDSLEPLKLGQQVEVEIHPADRPVREPSSKF